jgi:hypothetical protein
VQVQLRNVGLLPAGNLKVAVSSPNVALAAAAAAAVKQQDAAAAAAAGSTDVWQELLGKFNGRCTQQALTTLTSCLIALSLKHTQV